MAFNSGFDDREEVMNEINMTPLVDVMLVLLIVFMITVPVMTHSMRVDLPYAKSEPNIVLPETIVLSVGSDGSVLWNGTPVDSAALETRLSAVAAGQPQPEIHLHGDRLAAYGHVAETMSAVRRAGIQKLGFVTKPDTR
jgi:biopolymer transport protein ExbD